MRRGRNQLAAWHADKPGEKVQELVTIFVYVRC